MKILEELRARRLYFDGGYGSLFEKYLPEGARPEDLNITKSETVKALHLEYLRAGADIIKTNTFGVNERKYKNYKEYTESAVRIAREAVTENKGGYIAFDIGPLGELLCPYGSLDFEEAVAAFRTMGAEAERLGCDLILIETMSDLSEVRAALIGAREATDLPIFVTASFDKSGRLMTGADVPAFVAVAEGLGASCIGVNCGQGPFEMKEIVRDFVNYSSLPVIVNANAGLPCLEGGRAVYKMTPEEFARGEGELLSIGAHILGGCCGTSPEYIKALKALSEKCAYSYPNEKDFTLISSYTHAKVIGEKPLLIGERINPTGKKKLKEALKNSDYEYILKEAVREENSGAHILDVNAGLPEIDEARVLPLVVSKIQEVSALPLQLDSANPDALSAAARIYSGKALINSVNGSRESMDRVLPTVKKYGSCVIALTTDEGGIPKTAEGRVEIALKIIREAEKYGIPKKDIIVDPLTLSVSADKDAGTVTLSAVKALHKMGIKTCLGVSNVSFGLPMRDEINSTFFAMALKEGLSLAIMNPLSEKMMETYYASCALLSSDKDFTEFISYAENRARARLEETARYTENKIQWENSQAFEKSAEKNATRVVPSDNTEESPLFDMIYRGISDGIFGAVSYSLSEKKPLEVINSEIIPALNLVGEDFESGRVYLPRLLASADAASSAFSLIKEKIEKTDADASRKIVIATVKGDVHDIGKNIVRVMLESYGFSVIDLGCDVSSDRIIKAVSESGARLVALSALMTTTVKNMAEALERIHNECTGCAVIVGGAVLTEEYARMINADFYGKDAMAAVRISEEYFKNIGI